MRTHQIMLLLTAANCLVGHLGWAQQAPIALLAPVTPVVAQPAPSLGVEVQFKQAATPPTAATPPQNLPIIPDPVVIINEHYLTGMNTLGAIAPQQIAKIDIYKQGSGPMQWRSLTAPGIVSLTLKAKPKVKWEAKSLAAIKRSLKLHGLVMFELNGAPIQDESLQVITNAIAGFDITHTTADTAVKTIVNIRLVLYRPAPHSYPPGTIRIRGLAHQ